MAAPRDIADMLLRIDATTEGLRRELARADRETDNWSKKTERSLDKIDKSFAGLASSVGRFAAIAGVSLGTRELIRYADTWSDLNARVANAVGPGLAANDVMARIAQTARTTYSSLEQTAESFLRNNTVLTELGYTTEQQLDLSDALNNSLVVSGAKGQQAESVMNALGKAFATGSLRGEHFNTVVQSSDRVMKALADGLGVTTAELRRMAFEGELTTDRVVTALVSQGDVVRAESESMAATMGDGYQQIQNSLLLLVGSFDQATGLSGSLADSLIGVADAISELANRINSGEFDSAIQSFTGFVAKYRALSNELLRSEEREDPWWMRIGGAGAIGDALVRYLGFGGRDEMDQSVAAIRAAFDEIDQRAEEGRLARIAEETSRKVEDLLNNVELFGFAAEQLGAKTTPEVEKITAALEAEHRQLTLTNRELFEYNLLTAMGEEANKSGAAQIRQSILAQFDQNEALKESARIRQGVLAELDKYFDEEKKSSELREKSLEDLRYETDVMRRKAGVVGQSRSVQAALNDELRIEQMVRSDLYKNALPHQQQEMLKLMRLQNEYIATTTEGTEGLAQLWEETSRRMGDTAVQMWRDFIDGGRSAMDMVKDLFKDFLANMLHLAITRPIMVSMGLAAPAGGVGGLLGGAGGGGFGEIFNIAGLANTARTLWTGAKGLATGQGLSGFAGMFGGGASSGTMTQMAGMTNLLAEYGITTATNASATAANTTMMSKLSGQLSNMAGAWPLAVAMGMYQSGKLYDQGVRPDAGEMWKSANGNLLGQIGNVGASFQSAKFETMDKLLGGGKLAAILTGSTLHQAVWGGINKALFGGEYESTRGGIELGFGDDGFDPRAYERQTKKGGAFSSTKRRMIYSDLNSELDDVLNATYEQALDGIAQMYAIVGERDITDALRGVSVDSLLIGTAGKSEQTEEEIQEQIAAWFDDLSEAMVAAINPDLTTQRLASLSSAAMVVNGTLASLDLSLYDASITGAELAEQLIMTAGGLDRFAAGSEAYYSHFYSSGEHFNALVSTLSREFAGINRDLPFTRDSVRELVDGLDLLTDAGQRSYSTIINNADALHSYFQTLEAQHQSISQTADSFRHQLMMDMLGTADQQYQYLDAQANALAQLLPSLTDVSAIQQVYQEVAQLQRSAYNLLDTAGKQDVAEEYLKLATSLQETAQQQIAKAQQEQGQAAAAAIQKAMQDAISTYSSTVLTGQKQSNDVLAIAVNQFASWVNELPRNISLTVQGTTVGAFDR